ncbi:MFS transporter [Streptomyces sedi]|uniref:MFS transporter n=1 Tax=Streptomyces sedi TaxID=555059 RepID=A0A5C4UYU6_9ACTN|nr:MFS transporter [Streptomyces sedi]TNM28767.1 MFS transporter [Streptomyces sedi]
MPLPLYLLALAVFAMGTSEFMLAGLLPDIASDLNVTVGRAGLLTSGFAVGMVVGAPLVAASARRWPRRASLLSFVLVFAAAHLLGAVTTSFPVLLATRFLAALANAGFLAVALTAAAALVPPERKGRALAVLLSGTTVATVAGAPGGAALGALVNAATFGVLTFLAPVVTETAGLGELWVPVALVLFGVGAFAGVNAAGRFADRRPVAVLACAGPPLLLGWPATALLAERPWALCLLVLVQGALSFAVGATLITRVLYAAAGAPTMAGAYATASLNVGAAVGPSLAAPTLGTALGDVGPLWAGGALVAVALVAVAVLAPRGVLGASGPAGGD